MGQWTAIGALVLATGFAQGDPVPTTERLSVSSPGIQGNATSGAPLLSPDGRLAVFPSAASNLVPADRNRREDVFLRDRTRGETSRVGKSVSIVAPGSSVFYFDGRRVGVVKYSDASHYFLQDLASGAVTQMDLDANDRPAQLWLDDAPVLSATGGSFAFTGFDPDAEPAGIQAYVRNVAAGTTALVSVAAGGGAGDGATHAAGISADGRYVVMYSSATNLVAADTNGFDDVFVRDLVAKTTTRVNVDSIGRQANGSSRFAAVSADGRLVAFHSDASNLVPGDTNDASDVFVHDRVAGTTRRVSVTSAGAQAHGDSFTVRFLGPKLLGFESNAPDLVPGDTNEHFDHYVHELDTGRTVWAAAGRRRRSLPPTSYPLSFSADGRWVAFTSSEPGHVRRDTNRRRDAFVFGPLRQPWVLPDPPVAATASLRKGVSGGDRAAVARRARGRARPYDFDADGWQDLAVGVPRYQPHGAPDAGAVVVLRGTRSGPSTAPRLLSRDTPGVGGLPYGDDGLGMSLASGDFDGDGFADLAAGIPGDRAVYVFRGSARGLTGRGLRQLELRTDEPDPELFAPIGSVLVAGDLDRDGFDDLVVGPRPLRIHRGAARGLARRPYRTLAAPKGARPGFGSVLAVGDVNGDRDLDLVEGAAGFPLELDDSPTPGHLTYCPGARKGPIACRRFLGGRPGPASLAIADVTGDGYRDVVAGVPSIRFYNEDESVPGAVLLFPGGRRGPTKPLLLSPATRGVPGTRRRDDAFGTAVAAGRLDGDRFADIVVGGMGSIRSHGRVWILRGARAGLAGDGHRAFDQRRADIPGTRDAGRNFGAAVSVLDTDGRGRPDLVIAVPGTPNGGRGAGAVTVLHLARGLMWKRAHAYSLRTLDISALEAPDSFLTPAFGSVLGRSAASTG